MEKLPNKNQLIEHLSEKMTNQDIASIYGTTFQKIIQLIKKHNLNPNELRKVNKFTVYEHWFDSKVVYVGSGVWYRCRRYTNRRNSKHRSLMKEGKLTYKFVAEFDLEEDAREYEVHLIQKYKKRGLCRFNKKTL
ncbi:hypothetical protein [Bacillus pseudomycoides]|uniref:hypothetical protein n=1 Tax=Bacillus pseudomycoides TaxID=64104 RepID=UPI000BEDB97F|nr:hypothetical protein [Bacillus pseudomycoides]PDZ73855.1 hypothetical protein CON58_10055 [Bacillus pseudomycoides]